MAEKIKLNRPVIVEGKYDKNKLSSIIDADIITTDGFGIFKESDKKSFIRRIADKNGVFILTDSDGAGLVIRNYFNSILPKDKVTHLYIPQIKGREKRKTADSKEGFLGVEGVSASLLRTIFLPFAAENGEISKKGGITKTDLYEDGLLGSDDSAHKRAKLAISAGLPNNLSSNAFLAAINLLFTYEEYKELLK